MVMLVAADGHVENRVIEIPPGLPPSALQQAGNYLNNRLSGPALAELRVHRLRGNGRQPHRTRRTVRAGRGIRAGDLDGRGRAAAT